MKRKRRNQKVLLLHPPVKTKNDKKKVNPYFRFPKQRALKFNKTKKIHQEKSSNLCLYKILHFHKLTIREVFLDTKMHIAKQF